MSYEEFQAKFVKTNRWLWLTLIVSIFISSLNLFFILNRERFFIWQGGEIFHERPLSVDVCKKGFESIITGKPHPFFLTDAILDLLKKESFIIDLKQILKLKSLEENKCQLTIKDSQGLRSFIITLAAKDSWPFHYKIKQVDELEPTQQEEE